MMERSEKFVPETHRKAGGAMASKMNMTLCLLSDLECRFSRKVYWRDIVTMMMQPAIELEIMVKELRDTREISNGSGDPKSRQLLEHTTSGSRVLLSVVGEGTLYS